MISFCPLNLAKNKSFILIKTNPVQRGGKNVVAIIKANIFWHLACSSKIYEFTNSELKNGR